MAGTPGPHRRAARRADAGRPGRPLPRGNSSASGSAQSFIIENRTGASGIIGTGEAAKAAPDGYTLLLVASPHVNLEILAHNKPYQLMRDFTAGGDVLPSPTPSWS